MLAACTNNKTTGSFIPLQADKTKAVIYIYRPSVSANILYIPDLYINDEYRLPINNSNNYYLALTPGNYSFRLKHKKFSETDSVETMLLAGSVYFLRVDSHLELKQSAKYQPYHRKFTLSIIDGLLARQQISECCIKSQHTLDDTNIIKENSRASPGFSIEKTQNPFSH